MPKTIEVSRSFSFKLNVGNFETRDFFCAAKATCDWNEREKISKDLHAFCKKQVFEDVTAYRTTRKTN